MALTSSEFSAMHDAFVKACNASRGKRETTKFLKAVVREFGYSDVLEFRRNLTVVMERNGNREIHAYASNSDRFYQVAGQAVDTVD
jgi:Ca2+-binding EF-hand superfamily protein